MAGNVIGSHLKKSKFAKISLLPHMYVLIIGVSIAGAFLFSLVFVALYYYLNMNPAIKGYKMDRAPTFDGASSKAKKAEKHNDMEQQCFEQELNVEQQQQQQKQQQQQQEKEQEQQQQKQHREQEESDIEVDLDSLKSFGR